MWKENAKEIGRLSLEIEESSLGRDLARRAPQGASDLIASRIPLGQGCRFCFVEGLRG